MLNEVGIGEVEGMKKEVELQRLDCPLRITKETDTMQRNPTTRDRRLGTQTQTRRKQKKKTISQMNESCIIPHHVHTALYKKYNRGKNVK